MDQKRNDMHMRRVNTSFKSLTGSKIIPPRMHQYIGQKFYMAKK